MNKEKLNFYKEKLNQEKERVEGIIQQLKDNGMTKYNAEVSSELSFYDNHPADIAGDTLNVEIGRSLEANELSLLNKIESALESIDNGTYGTCKQCGKDIDKGRLDFLPYAENCIECEDTISKIKTYNSNSRVVEESVITEPFGSTFSEDSENDIGLDAGDIYQKLEDFNKIDGVEEYDDEDDDVEEIEKISNEQYKNQLP